MRDRVPAGDLGLDLVRDRAVSVELAELAFAVEHVCDEVAHAGALALVALGGELRTLHHVLRVGKRGPVLRADGRDGAAGVVEVEV